MKVGDMVTLKDWCKDGGKTFIITEIPVYINSVKIMNIETFQFFSATKDNIISLEAK
jgi:hypothetical protein